MKYFSLIVISLLYNNVAYAYLDPGSGSIMLQAMIATFAVAGGIISTYWTKLISLFKKRPPAKKSDEQA